MAAAWAGPGVRAQDAPLAQAEDLSAAGLAFVEIELARDTFLLAESFTVRLRFGLERELLRERAVQLFQRALDVPVQVQAPLLAEHVRLHLRAEPDSSGALAEEQGATFALGESFARARRVGEHVRDGRTYVVFEHERTATAAQVGSFTWPAPVLGFAYATQFDADFVQGRVPRDRHEAFVRGVETRLTLAPPPAEGRPAEFTGAVGRFRLEASAAPQDLVLGASLELRVRVLAEDPGQDLATTGEPRLGEWPELHLHGTLVERTPGALSARYDLIPRVEGALEIPPVRFAFFDTTPPAGYRTLATEPIPLVVRAPAAPQRTTEPELPARAPPTPHPPGARGLALLAGGLVLLVAFGLALRGLRAQRRRAR